MPKGFTPETSWFPRFKKNIFNRNDIKQVIIPKYIAKRIFLGLNCFVDAGILILLLPLISAIINILGKIKADISENKILIANEPVLNILDIESDATSIQKQIYIDTPDKNADLCLIKY